MFVVLFIGVSNVNEEKIKGFLFITKPHNISMSSTSVLPIFDNERPQATCL